MDKIYLGLPTYGQVGIKKAAPHLKMRCCQNRYIIKNYISKNHPTAPRSLHFYGLQVETPSPYYQAYTSPYSFLQLYYIMLSFKLQ